MLLAQARRTMAARGLVDPGTKVLVACSGGPDSAALLGVLVELSPELGLTLEAATVNHGLRASAVVDAEIARRQAEQVGVPFFELQVRVSQDASLQAQARAARYAALAELARARGAVRIAVGHTRDDQAETVILRLLRGAGVRGLAAIAPRRADGVIRPLIDCERASVHAYAQEHFPEIARDSSNHDPRYERTRVREQVLPSLLREDPALVRHLSELADDARECFELVNGAAHPLYERARIDDRSLCISVLLEAPPVLRRAVLQRWVESASGPVLGRAHVEQLEAALLSGRGEIWLSRGFAVRVEPGGTLRLHARGGSAVPPTP